MTIAQRILCGCIVVLGLSGVQSAMAGDDTIDLTTPAAKVDSGLGEVGAYATWNEPWVYAMPAEKRDSGLGELPGASGMREGWLFSQPAPKLDSGLGDLVPAAHTRGAPAPRAGANG